LFLSKNLSTTQIQLKKVDSSTKESHVHSEKEIQYFSDTCKISTAEITSTGGVQNQKFSTKAQGLISNVTSYKATI
jgi:hypothetical protein